jgi:hypothetical protein
MKPAVEEWFVASRGVASVRKKWPLPILGIALLIAASTRWRVPGLAGVLLIMGQAYA